MNTAVLKNWDEGLRAARKYRAGAQSRLAAVLDSSLAAESLESVAEMRRELTDSDLVAEQALQHIMATLIEGCSTWGEVVKRAYAWALATRPELLGSMTCGEVASIFGQGRAAMSDRVLREFSAPLRRAGFRCSRVPWQRDDQTRLNASLRMAGKRQAAREGGL